MSRFRLSIGAAALLFVFASANADEPAFVVAGYLPDYRLDRWNREVESGNAKAGPVTDIVFFGMSAPSDWRFDALALSNAEIETLAKLKGETKRRLLFTVGGWSKSRGFAELARSEESRLRFVQDACRFCADRGFEGIDYDWEHPDGEAEIAAYAALLQATRDGFDRLKASDPKLAERQFLVTVAQASWQDLGKKAYDAVDRVHLMSYDHEFPQATMEKSRADVERLIEFGCPREKIVLGIPFYGRRRDRDAKTYVELVGDSRSPATANEIDGYAFNGPELVAEKTLYAKRERLGGVMIWELGQDAAGEKSLLGSIEKALAR